MLFATSLARLSSVAAALGLALGMGVVPLPTAIAENSIAMPLYREGHASPDGIGKFYQGREIAAVMGFEAAPWLERPGRAQEERPDALPLSWERTSERLPMQRIVVFQRR